MLLSRLLARLVAWGHDHALPVFIAGLVLAVFGGWYAYANLGISTDTDKLFSERLPWRQRSIALSRDFPQFQDLIVVVIDGTAPEAAEATAASLASALAADHAHIVSVSRPDASPFLAQSAFLFLETKQLETVLNSTIDAQPLLGQLAADPSARGLFAALALLGVGVQRGDTDLQAYLPSLQAFHEAMGAALDGRPRPLSWSRLLGGNLIDLAGQYRFVLVHPKLDFGTMQPGGAATATIRAAVSSLDLVRSGDARVRITGSVALADEEFATAAHGMIEGLVGSLILITLWLFLALRTWRLMLPALLTLLLGLMVTLLFAAVVIGTLNLVSVGFGILFVGIAVDFAIQFSVRYRERRLHAPGLVEALAETGQRVGVQILVAAAATATGFLAFVPTDFAGVAELGLIAGIGMLIAFGCTILFLPAAITLFRPGGEAAEVGFRWAAPIDPLLRRVRVPVLAVFSLLAALGAILLPRLTFDPDPLHTKAQNTEAVRTLYDLMGSPLTNPFTVDVLTPDERVAKALAARLAKVPSVSEVLSIDSLIPDDQPAKLALIADANNILAATLSPREAAAPVTPEQVRLAAHTALEQIKPALPKLPQNNPLRALAGDLERASTASDAIVAGLEGALTRFLPAELDQLRTALNARPVTLDTIPADIKRDWLLPDGQARVQAVPKRDALTPEGLRRFVAEVRAVAPDAGGSAVAIEAASETIVNAFRSAAIGAIIAITIILFLALRHPLDVGLVLAPLLLSGLLTVVVSALAPLPLNYANIIALPLLLGVGVSFNIYFVMNWRAGQRSVLGSATARAILFSALTTATAFGSLALSGHPGTASMGTLLLISLGCTLLASLVFIPALLAAVPSPRMR